MLGQIKFCFMDHREGLLFAGQFADLPDAHDNGSFLILIRKRMTDMPGSLEALQDSIRAVDNFPDADPDSPASRALQVSCAGGGEGIRPFLGFRFIGTQDQDA